MKTIIIKGVFCFIILFFLHIGAAAQPDDNGGDPPPSDVPLDGGTTILIATGVAYGVKAIKKHRDKKQKTTGY